jgi:hypothetical protein
VEFSKAEINWNYLGIALARGEAGSYDADVAGDPCIVWDPERGRYRMFYFALCRSQQKGSCNAQAISAARERVGAGQWEKLGPLRYTNPEALLGGHTHKPWVMMDPWRPNRAAQIAGEYYLFTVSYQQQHKTIQLATSRSLSGPWNLRPAAVVAPGDTGSIDAYHADTVTAYWFEDRGQILIFYKGYPDRPQHDQPLSPWGSCLCAATMRPGDSYAAKLGILLRPVTVEQHWLSGWVSGLQLLPAAYGGWHGLMTGSPTPPDSIAEQPSMREPAPSLGGFARTDQPWPISGWLPDDRPIWELEDIPQAASDDGMGVNLWRHHMLIAHDGTPYLYCNAGAYGSEAMFVRKGVVRT